MTANGYFKKWESFVQPTDGHSVTGDYDPLTHGTSGPIKTTIRNYNFAVDDIAVSVAKNQQVPGYIYSMHPGSFPWPIMRTDSDFLSDPDVNSGVGVGVGYEPSFTGTGIRYSSAQGYLHDNNVFARANLDVLIGAQAIKLTYAPVPSSSSTPVVSGLQYTAGQGQTVYTVKASKEVILAAGALDR